MTALKQLSAIYIAAASAYGVTVALAHHPDWAAAARTAARFTAETGATAAAGLNSHVLKPGYAFTRDEASRGYHALVEMNAPPTRVAEEEPKPKTAKPEIARAAPAEKPDAPLPRPEIAAHEPQANVTLDIAPPLRRPPPENTPSSGPAELANIEQRLKDNLSGEMLANFDLFLYVSKAEKGPLAQRMYVFAKQPSGDLVLRYDWPVSTGREKVEYNKEGWKLPSFTPQGYYELDPKRFYRHYTSIQWKQPMPYAMFFDWVQDGNKTGLAIHAAHGKDITLLGQRASAGCVRLAPQDAALLFDLIRTQYKGEVPRFAYDKKTATMSNEGLLLRDAKGNLSYTKGYKVLVFIENYGGENVVAALM